ncbi:hypothetical protein ZOSMA_52G00420 [Zostera marina]|uniref:Uncharacterized protein n=1 Tax=Zostera marina TaxID=29655 RepID=A0A0K9NX66_ZOSMR|nr:hypothetical protein ZOSMA_52G00420 [Zostera marina]
MPTIWVKSNTVDVGVGVGCYVTILSIHLPGSRMWMLSSDNQHPHTKTTKIIKSHLPRISINSSASDKIKGAVDAAQSTGKDETSKLDTAETPKPDPAHSTGTLDTGKLAGAAGDILSSVSDYGNLKDSSAGQYVEKAETYLQDYKEKHSTTTTAPIPTPTSTPETEAPKE